jgi:hypothetical protein
MDEQIATKEEYLKRINMMRNDQIEGQEMQIFKINDEKMKRNTETSNQLTLKPLIFGGPSPGESLKDANLSLSSSRLNTFKIPKNEQSAILISEAS